MKVFYGSESFPATLKNPIVALGNFDGVHRAHQKMFQWAKRWAQRHQGKSVAYTFEPHPVKVLSPDTAPPRITSLPQKLELMAWAGLDLVVVEHFHPHFAQWSPETWFSNILVKRLHARGVIAGYDFTFGSKRSGTLETLHRLCSDHNIECYSLPAQLWRGTLISSTQVRRWTSEGKIEKANALLGHPFFLEGEVVRGQGRGQALGIPTANLQSHGELIPKAGVYISQVLWGKHQAHGITNVGNNPTFGSQSLNIETHLLNFSGNLYGKKLRIVFLKRLRDEKKFPSADALVKQILHDRSKAETFFRKKPKNLDIHPHHFSYQDQPPMDWRQL